MKYIFLWISLFLFCLNLASAEDFITMKYPAKEGESLKKIIISFLAAGVSPAKANSSLLRTMKENPDVKPWNPLSEDVTFTLYLNKAITDLKKYDDFVKKNNS